MGDYISFGLPSSQMEAGLCSADDRLLLRLGICWWHTEPRRHWRHVPLYAKMAPALVLI